MLCPLERREEIVNLLGFRERMVYDRLRPGFSRTCWTGGLAAVSRSEEPEEVRASHPGPDEKA